MPIELQLIPGSQGNRDVGDQEGSGSKVREMVTRKQGGTLQIRMRMWVSGRALEKEWTERFSEEPKAAVEGY